MPIERANHAGNSCVIADARASHNGVPQTQGSHLVAMVPVTYLIKTAIQTVIIIIIISGTVLRCVYM